MPNRKLGFKVVNFVQKTEEIVEESRSVVEMTGKGRVVLKSSTKDGAVIELTATAINQAS